MIPHHIYFRLALNWSPALDTHFWLQPNRCMPGTKVTFLSLKGIWFMHWKNTAVWNETQQSWSGALLQRHTHSSNLNATEDSDVAFLVRQRDRNFHTCTLQWALPKPMRNMLRDTHGPGMTGKSREKPNKNLFLHGDHICHITPSTCLSLQQIPASSDC